MSDTKFTPGPWRMSDECAYGWDILQDAGHFNWIGAAHNNELLRDPKDDEEGLANARLIAAAPDMYQALQHALIDMDAIDRVTELAGVHKFRLLRDEITAAIAKADGVKA